MTRIFSKGKTGILNDYLIWIDASCVQARSLDSSVETNTRKTYEKLESSLSFVNVPCVLYKIRNISRNDIVVN